MIKKTLAISMLAASVSLPALAADSDALFSYEGKDYRMSDLKPWLQQTYYETQVEAQEKLNQILEQAMVEMYISKLAEKSGKTIEEIHQDLIKVEEVSAEEVKVLYEQFKDRIGRPLEEVEANLRQELLGRKQQQAFAQLIEKIKKETGFVSKVSKPAVPTLAMDLSGYQFRGGKNAEITIVEFADYNCGFCRVSKPEIDRVVGSFGDKVKMYHIDFPVTERGVAGSSTQTARGAFCAGEQDKFWEYNAMAYKEPVSMDGAATFAKTLKMDMDKFNTCLTSNESMQFVQDSTKLAMELGVRGTPSVFVNGQKVQIDALESEIQKRL